MKLYSSEKEGEGDKWRHSRIVLRPDSNIEGYDELVFDVDSAGELRVVDEFVAVIG